MIKQDLAVPKPQDGFPYQIKPSPTGYLRRTTASFEAIDAHRLPVTDVEAENAKLKLELAEVRMERDILKKPSRTLPRCSCRYAVMKQLHIDYPINILCRMLEVSKSGYHAFIMRKPSRRATENARLEIAIKAAHARTRKSYGHYVYKTSCMTINLGPVSVASVAYVKILGFVANSYASSTSQRTQIPDYRWRITSLNKTLIPRRRTKLGSPILPMYPPRRVGCMSPV